MPGRTLNLHRPKLEATRDGYGQALLELGKTNQDVVVLCGDLTESTRTQAFAKAYPERFIEVGVAEQNLVGLAAGLAAVGKLPFVATYAAFVPGRAFDQIRVQLAYAQANVKLSGAHAGLSVGPDGATHQMLEDLALMRALPNMTVLAPTDAEETRKATLAAAAWPGPVYLRFGRQEVPTYTTPETPFQIGQAHIFRRGDDVSIIAAGILTYEALQATDVLAKHGLSAEVIHSPSVKPLDEATILHSAVKTNHVLTLEEAQIAGGLGGAVAELLSERQPTKLRRLGVQNTFGQSGNPDELLKHYGLDSTAIVRAARQLVGR